MAAQIHKLLEKVRIPADLISGLDPDLSKSRKLYPVFRDKEELPSATSISEALKQHLEQSAYLIVLCSPEAASSHWVNEEVKYFQRLGRGDRILCLVVRRDQVVPGAALDALFPVALRAENGDLPLAADLTQPDTTVSKEVARLAAGILGVSFDLLYRRERRRRRRVAAVLAASAIAISLPLGVGWFYSQRLAAMNEFQSLVNSSLYLAEQSQAAVERLDYEGAVAIALEGMPDNTRGQERPLVPKLQAALSRSFWKLPDLKTIGDGSTGLAAVLTDSGVVSLNLKNAEEWAVYTDGVESELSLPQDITTADIAGDGNFIAAGTQGGELHILSRMGESSNVVSAHSDTVMQVRISNLADRIATLGGDGYVRVWAQDGSELMSQLFDGGALSISFSRDGELLVVGSWQQVSIWKIGSKQPIFTERFEMQSVTAATISPDNRLIAINVDGEVKIIEFGIRYERGRFDAPGEFLNFLDFNSAGDMLLGHQVEGVTHVWDLESYASIGEFLDGNFDEASARFSSSGETVVLSDGPRLWKPGAGPRAMPGPPSGWANASSRAIHNGNIARYDSRSQSTELITRSGKKVSLKMESDGPLTLDVSSDEEIIATADSVKTQFWDAEGNELLTVPRPASYIKFSDDQKLLLAQSDNVFWAHDRPILGQELVTAARQKLSRCLDEAERAALKLAPASDVEPNYCK